MSIAVALILVVIFFTFVFTVVKAAKEWRWFHITSAVIAMLLSITFLFPTAGALKSRKEWHKFKEDLEGQLETVKREYQRLQYGDPDDPTAGEGLKHLSQRLSKIGTEAGRRWRSLQVVGQDAAAQQYTLQRANNAAAPAIDPTAAPAAPATGELVPVGLVVYGFAEGPFPNLNRTVPLIFLGEFKVDASVGNSVTVSPTVELSQVQKDILSSGMATTWSLYEMLPLDGHSPFVADGSEENDDNIYGRIDDELVQTLLNASNKVIFDRTQDQEVQINDTETITLKEVMQQEFQQTLTDYLQDGNRATPEDPAARWVKIRFDKKYTIDVDSPDQRGALEGGFFDDSGRAVDSRLQRRGDSQSVEFNPGDIVVVKEEAANQLADQEKVATKVDTFFVRPLNDYRYVLRRIRLQVKELDIRIAEMESEKVVLNAAIASTVNMLEKGQTEKLKLEQDFAQFQVETKAIRAYHDQVRDDLRQTREASAALYQRNFELLNQIRKLASDAVLTGT